MDTTKHGTMSSKISYRSFVGLFVAALDMTLNILIESQIYKAHLMDYYLKRYTYRTSAAELLSYSVFRVVLLTLASLLTLSDSEEYPKRFRKLNHIILILNGLLSLSVIAKILTFYGSSAYVSWLFWENCLISVFFCVLNTLSWQYIANIDIALAAEAARKQRKENAKGGFLEASRSTTIMEGSSFDVSTNNILSIEEALSTSSKVDNGKPNMVHVRHARKLLVMGLTDIITLLTGLVFSILSALCEVCIPYIEARIVIEILESSKPFDKKVTTELMIFGGIIMVAKSVLILLRSMILSRAKDKIELKIQSILFHKMLQEDQSFFDKRSADSLMQRITTDVERTAEMITQSLTTLIRNLIKSTIVFLFLTVGISWQLSFVMLGIIPILVYMTVNYTNRVNYLRDIIDSLLGHSFETVSECFRKIKTVKQFGTEKYEAQHFKRSLKKIDAYKRVLSYRIGIFKGSLSFIQVSFLSSILIYGGQLVTTNLITTHEFLIFLFMHVDMIEGIEEIGRSFTELLQNSACGTRLIDTMERLHTNQIHECSKKVKTRKRTKNKKKRAITSIGDDSEPQSRLLPNSPPGDMTYQTIDQYRPRDVSGRIEFDSVQFCYNKGKETARNEVSNDNESNSHYALENVSFTIEPGQIVALVGKSGCGKSTCLRLLSRMYKPNLGQILLDGKPIQDYELSFFHEKVVHVSSEVELLDRSVKENIQYGILGASEIDLIQAAKQAKAEGYLEEFYDKWDTQMHHKMSANKEYKLYLGRALIRKPKVVLIDEVAMKLDVETEELFERQLLRTRRDSLDTNNITYAPTILIIAHKLSTIQRSDKIIVMDNGRVVGEGTHEKLIQTNTFYLDLVRKQMSLLGQAEKVHRGLTKQRSGGGNTRSGGGNTSSGLISRKSQSKFTINN